MDDQLDNDLKNHIKEVFENYQDTSADAGWLLLREKYPEKAKRRPVAWIWLAVAALLLLFLSIGLFLIKKEGNKQQLAYNAQKKQHNKLIAGNMFKPAQPVKTRADSIANLKVMQDKGSSALNRPATARQEYTRTDDHRRKALVTASNKSFGVNRAALNRTVIDTSGKITKQTVNNLMRLTNSYPL